MRPRGDASNRKTRTWMLPAEGRAQTRASPPQEQARRTGCEAARHPDAREHVERLQEEVAVLGEAALELRALRLAHVRGLDAQDGRPPARQVDRRGDLVVDALGVDVDEVHALDAVLGQQL